MGEQSRTNSKATSLDNTPECTPAIGWLNLLRAPCIQTIERSTCDVTFHHVGDMEQAQTPRVAVLLQELPLEYPGDSTEFCPIEEFQNILAVGSYKLNEAEKTRSGALGFYCLENNLEKEAVLKNICNLPSVGILDLKWCSKKIGEKVLIGAATAEGLTLYDCTNIRSSTTPTPLSSYRLEGTTDLSLSLDWNNRLIEDTELRIATSQSNKTLSIFSIHNAGISLERTWSAHQHEVWVVAYNCHSPTQILSGSDDCFLKGWDVRAPASQPSFTKRLNAGVTSIQFTPLREHVFAVGSYDDHLHLFDIRAVRSGPVASVNTGGGVFRVKFHPRDRSRMATANMYNGFATVQVEEGQAPSYSLRIESIHTKPHDSIAYGIDWCQRTDCSNLLASASFYDKRLTLWKTADR